MRPTRERCGHTPSVPLFGLAPGGVCPATDVATRAVRSYRTISPLPDLAKGLRRCIFCGTFRRLAPPRRYLAPCPLEPGLSSTGEPAAAVWPTLGTIIPPATNHSPTVISLRFMRQRQLVKRVSRQPGDAHREIDRLAGRQLGREQLENALGLGQRRRRRARLGAVHQHHELALARRLGRAIQSASTPRGPARRVSNFFRQLARDHGPRAAPNSAVMSASESIMRCGLS